VKAYLIVGAGLSGAVLSRELVSRSDCRVTIVEQREHIAGNCHTERDLVSGVMLHRYGPHIFNTNREDVWKYVNRFARFEPWINRVKANTHRGVFPLPINLMTINLFFGKRFSPAEAKAFLGTLGDTSIGEPANFEEQALKFVGRELYETFFRSYTLKQWGCDPRELPASILKRLPVRFNYDDNYYDARYQGIPAEGYTALIANILDHPAIEVQLGARFTSGETGGTSHVFYTGPLDVYYDYRFGRLGYRTVSFERIDAEGDYQGNALLNYPDADVPFTRIHEHKHFAPWEQHERTVAFREYSSETGSEDEPFYPKRLAPDKRLLAQYRALAAGEKAVSFLGRLATYRYLDMDDVIGEAHDFADQFLAYADNPKARTAPVFPNAE
jgi:UDP-galactopyranose mutase